MLDTLPSRAQLVADEDHARCMARRAGRDGDTEARLSWVAVANQLSDQIDALAIPVLSHDDQDAFCVDYCALMRAAYAEGDYATGDMYRDRFDDLCRFIDALAPEVAA